MAAAVAAVFLALLGWLAGEPPRIPQDVLLAAIEKGNAPRILDVRTTREYVASHVPGAIHVPYHELWLRRAAIRAAEDSLIVVYCSHGLRAGMAKLQLWMLGYDNVAYLQGQMSAWQRRSLPVEARDVP